MQLRYMNKIVQGQKHIGENILGQNVTGLTQTVSATCMGDNISAEKKFQDKTDQHEHVSGKADIIYWYGLKRFTD
jgi:hypothetical protein